MDEAMNIRSIIEIAGPQRHIQAFIFKFLARHPWKSGISMTYYEPLDVIIVFMENCPGKIMAGEIEVTISSALDKLELVQTFTDCITDFMRFDEDTAHWIGMSVRESVTNAIQHGNRLDMNKRVSIRFEIEPDRLAISVKDQGQGFRADELPNPLDSDNLLKPSGRGVFFIRTFMDEVEFRTLSHGGTEVHMVKKISSNKESIYEDRNTHRW